MKIRITQIKKKRGCSGQIMAEACIGLSLLTFVWILISYTSFMSTNWIRTAMASRHAAWRVAKEGIDPQAISQEINDDFFYNSFATVEKGDAPFNRAGSVGVPILTTPLRLLHNPISDSGPNRTRVTFGIMQTNLNSPDVAYPFSLMNADVPFMTNSLLAGFLSVNSQCQWAAIDAVWIDQPSDPMNRLPLSLLHTVGSGLNTAFGWWSSAYNSLARYYYYLVEYPPCEAAYLACMAQHLLPWQHRNCTPCNPPADAAFGCQP
jgi:hypothetical protein